MISFRPAKRSEAKPLIGLYSESGCGKTWSSLLLARGFVGPAGQVGMIETESGRGEAYADLLPGGYSVLSMRDDATKPRKAGEYIFSPEQFGEAIGTAEEAHLDALIIDSASDEWESGVLLMADDNEAAGKKGMQIWNEPKNDHKRRFINRLLGTPIPLVILNMRARYAMEDYLDAHGKKQQRRATTLTPYQGGTILFEMFIHGWIDQQHRFHGTKYSRDDLRDVLRDNEPITLQTGERLAAWARGTSAGTVVSERPSTGLPAPAESGATSGGGTGGTPRTPVDDWEDELNGVKTVPQRAACWQRILPNWGSLIAVEQKRLAEANKRAMERVGG